MMSFKKVILSCLLLVSCAGNRDPWTEGQAGGRLKVLSTTAQVGDLVKVVGGDRVESRVLIEGELDPHSYEIVKGDREKFSGADLIFYNGLGLEHGASLFSFLQNSPKAVAVGEEIRRRAPEKMIARGAVIDPHIWMDISLWKEGIDPIVAALSQADPEGALLYRERGDALAAEMERVHLEIRERLHQIPTEKRYLVTSHDAFHYFTRSYLAEPGESNWEERFAAPEGLAPEGQLNGRDLQKILGFLKEKNITVLFPESNVSRDSIRKIERAGKELGLEVRICREPLYGDAMSGLTYLEMMRHNAKVMAEYL